MRSGFSSLCDSTSFDYDLEKARQNDVFFFTNLYVYISVSYAVVFVEYVCIMDITADMSISKVLAESMPHTIIYNFIEQAA